MKYILEDRQVKADESAWIAPASRYAFQRLRLRRTARRRLSSMP